MHDDRHLNIHLPALQLVNEPLELSPGHIELLNTLEHHHHIHLPSAVRSWYSLSRAVDILSQTGQDHPIPVTELGNPIIYWSGETDHRRDLIAEGLLLILIENQGTYGWAVQLNESDDPPVLIAEDCPMPFARWETYIDRFSQFIFTYVWDSLGIRSTCGYRGWTSQLLPEELVYLRTHFTEGPMSFVYPGLFNYRFSRSGQYLLIHELEQEVEWYLWGNSEQAIFSLVRTLKRYPTLRTALQLEYLG